MKKIADEKNTAFVSSKILREPIIPTTENAISIFEATKVKKPILSVIP